MPAETYDDGNLTTPGGCLGAVERVIVIGAGMAGLATANALFHAGVECVILEARDRIGGRLHTVDVGGVPTDMGGSWIHTPVGNPMRRFADQAGVPCRDGNALRHTIGYDRAERRRLAPDEFDATLAVMFDGFPAEFERLRAELGPHASAAEGIDRFIGEAGMGAAESRRARIALRSYVSADASDLPERQSMRWFWQEDEYGGDHLGDVPVGGYRRLVEAMGGGLTIRLETVVTTVEVTQSGVRVETADGSAELGSHVVCTLPLGVLKHGSVRFEPALPGERLDAIERLGFGRFEKIAASFDEPFWQAAGMPHLMSYPEDPDDLASWILGQDATGAGPALVMLVHHANSDRVLRQAPEAAAGWMLDVVSEAIGQPCPTPTAVVTSSWGTDPHSLGSYSHITPEASPDDMDHLGRPHLGRLLFAGEATIPLRLGYADGAMQSGIREAKRLLRQPSVTLAPIAAGDS